MTIPTPRPTPEGEHQVDALTQRFTRAVGFFIVPTPSEGKPSPGTGLLVQFQGKKYLVSALHNFFHDVGGKDQVIRSWEAIRFEFRDDSPLGRVESLNQAVSRVKSEYGQTLALSLPEWPAHRYQARFDCCKNKFFSRRDCTCRVCKP